MTTEFNKSDFEKLRFRVDLIDLLETDILHVFPELKYREEFSPSNLVEASSKHAKIGQILAFIVYVYDFNSPYAKKYNDDILKRKKVVADAVLFGRNPLGEFYTPVTNIIQCKNDTVNKMIICFLRILKNQYWSSLCTYQEALRISEACLLNPEIESKDKKANLEMAITLRKEIAQIQQSFLVDGNSNLESALYDAIEDEELATPEFIALKLFQKEKPMYFNPYHNRLPIDKFMEKLKNGESVYEWDNPDLIQRKRERDDG